MRVVFAPDSFKGTVPAAEVARALAAGWADVDPAAEVVLRPMADGGEGTLEAFATAVPAGRRIPIAVDHPTDSGPAVHTEWLLLPPNPQCPGGTGVVELASTAGIGLLGDSLDPWGADTRGFGQAIRAALDHGVSRLIFGIGSSGSTDGGVGMLEALGARIDPPRRARGARGLEEIRSVELSASVALPPQGAVVLTDVTNPLLGPQGAATVFGPQKGFRDEETPLVDPAMADFARHIDVDPETPGAGAAGGTGFALLAWGAQLVSGAGHVGELIGLPAAIADADYVVTGEGSYDTQSAAGKVPTYVASVADRAGIPVGLVCGRLDGGDLAPFAQVVSLTELAEGPDAAMNDARRWLRAAGAELAEHASRG